MAKFTYTAENHDGDIYKGVADARDRFDLYKIIRREGGKVLSVTKTDATNIWNFRYWNAKFTTVSDHQKIVFARNLGSMIGAGLSLSRALSVLERQTKNIKLSDVVSRINSEVRRGGSLHESLEKFPHVFSRLFVAMVKSGEEAGNLPDSLKAVANQMDQAYTLKKKVRGALIYPSIIVVAIIGIGTLMLTEVVPTLAQTFEEVGAELPVSTQTIIAISNFLVEHTVTALILFVSVVALGFAALRTHTGRRMRDLAFLKTPLIGGIVREVNAARTARTMSSLLAAGVDMLTTLSITEEVVQNLYFKDVLKGAAKDIERGGSLAKPFARREDLYPPLVGEMVAVGEETGALTDMLGRVALFYEEEVSRKTKDMSTVIEPFLMIIIGSAVGFFALSMIAPIYTLSDSI